MRIAIAGYGLEGKANYKYWSQLHEDVTIVDEREDLEDFPKGVSTILGPDAFGKLADFDLVIRTAGLSPARISTNGKIWSATNEFFSKCPALIVGVTGTKGKGTTSTLIASLLEAAGRTVHLVGNIGSPALTELSKISPDDVVVYELSSFQLWDIEFSPTIAVLLGVEPGHLDIHANADEYFAAKANIFRFQTADDVAICHPTNQTSLELCSKYKTAKTRIKYASKDGGGVYEELNNFCTQEGVLTEVRNLQLPGPHNVENACAALSVARQLGVSPAEMTAGLQACKGLEHRLEIVKTIDGVMYVNDSFSSAPSATVAAVRSFQQPKILVVGGLNKGADFSVLANELVHTDTLKKVLLIGESRNDIAAVFAQANVPNVELVEALTMAEVLNEARQYATDGGVVLFSPGCSSFDMFKNFYDRGEQFKREVEQL